MSFFAIRKIFLRVIGFNQRAMRILPLLFTSRSRINFGYLGVWVHNSHTASENIPLLGD